VSVRLWNFDNNVLQNLAKNQTNPVIEIPYTKLTIVYRKYSPLGIAMKKNAIIQDIFSTPLVKIFSQSMLLFVLMHQSQLKAN
jgi:hypothetical protein